MHGFILIFTDFSIVIAAFILSLLFRFKELINVVEHQWFTFIFLLLIIPVIFYFYDLYNHLLYTQRLRIFFRIIKAWLVGLLVYVIIGFLTKFHFLIESRAFIIGFYILLLFFLILVRLILVKKILENYFSCPGRQILCKYVGPSDKFKVLSRFFSENTVTGLRFVVPDKTHGASGGFKKIFFYSKATSFSELYNEIKSNLSPGLKLHIASGLFNRLNLNWEWCNIDSFPVYTFHQKRNQFFRNCLRRVIDIVGSIFGLIILAPFFAIIAIAIKLNSRGSVIYKQERCGENGKKFIFYKFRSMYERDEKDAERESGSNSYIKKRTPKEETINNKDITNLGRILRKTSADEWPQFINVLKGEMSLIGPRPPLPYEVKYYEEWHKDRLSVKQGLTGLWQIYGRGEMPCDKSIFLDLIYVVNRSISLDIKLIFQTIPVVILGKGAY